MWYYIYNKKMKTYMSEQIAPPDEVYYKEEGNFSGWLDANDEGHAPAFEVITKDRQAQRERIEAALPHDESGLDLASVDTFIVGLGLRTVGRIVVGETDEKKSRQRLREMGVIGQEEGNFAGFYHSVAELAIVFRHKKHERKNGPGFTESLVVHEQAHGSSTFNSHSMQVQVDERSINYAQFRMGQVVISGGQRNIFLEEAFADAVRGKYVREVLDKPGGFAGVESELDTYKAEAGDELPILPEFSMRDKRGRKVYIMNALAGSALEFMAQNDPGLWPALLEARSSVEGLREVARRIETIEPGLYTKLSRLTLSRADFEEGLRLVADAADVPAPAALRAV
jgi:hypothetical protein